MIKIEDFKQWRTSFNYHFYNTVGNYFSKFKDKDKRHNRIYFKLNAKPTEKIFIPYELSEYLEWKQISVVDYNKGLCILGVRKIRIGKLLVDLGREDLLKAYSKSKQGLKNTDNLTVVISRHHYDCMGMSTNRGWSTCLDLNDKKYDGQFLDGLRNYLREGCLVSYLIRDDDRNINNPISRITITNLYGKLCAGRCYGTYVSEYTKFINDFVENYNNQLITN